MVTFLAIYSKSKKIDLVDENDVVNDFTINGSRTIIKKAFDGFKLYAVDKFQSAIYENDDSISLVSGHISFEKVLDMPQIKSTPEGFNDLLNKNRTTYLPQLEGAFAALHYNKSNHTLSFTNDKFGIFPLFIFENSQYIILSNEYQAIAQYKQQAKYVNNEAIAEFLTLGVTIGNKTFFKNIKNLEPASFVVSSNHKTIQHTYWEPEMSSKNTMSSDELSKEIHSTFTKINQEYNNTTLTDFCLLTAGADSRLIVSTLTAHQLANTKFYTSNLSFLDPLYDKDVIGAVALATKFNLKHTVKKISFFENQFNESYFDNERELRESQVYGGWHGGEFLGGYCLKAAPIHTELDFDAIDKRYKSIFNWWFRLKLKKHPYQSYLEEKEKLKGNTLLFMIHQMTRSFFSNIYSGTRGHWVQPFQLMNHGYSPFWDSRFLQLLIQIPIHELENYAMYNRVFKHCDKAFTDIPSNSPLTNREDSLLPKMEIGIEPKHQIPNTHHKAYKDSLHNAKIWNRYYYNKKEVSKILENEFDVTTKQWLDFEMWYSRYIQK